jgi:hypothetical protein
MNKFIKEGREKGNAEIQQNISIYCRGNEENFKTICA